MPQQRYEVAIYNQSVRDCMDRGETHRQLSDDWSEIRYIELAASSLEDLRDKIEQRFPSRRGFVIEYCVEVD